MLQANGLQIDGVFPLLHSAQQIFAQLQLCLLLAFLINNDLIIHQQFSNEILLSEPGVLMEEGRVHGPFVEVRILDRRRTIVRSSDAKLRQWSFSR